MARPKDIKARVLGPYEERNGFRIIHVKRGGERDTYFVATKEEAQRTVEALTIEVERPTTTIHEALKRYLTYMGDEKGNKPNSVEQTRIKMSRFFPDLFMPIADLDHAMCAGYYEALRTSKQRSAGRARRTDRSRWTTTGTCCPNPGRS